MLSVPFEVVTLKWIVANCHVSESHVRRAAKEGWLETVGIGYSWPSVSEWIKHGYPTTKRTGHVSQVQDGMAVDFKDKRIVRDRNGQDQKGSRSKRKVKVKKPFVYHLENPSGSLEGNGA
jgi:hypothetical protein